MIGDPGSRDPNYELIGLRGSYTSKIQKYFYFFYYDDKFPISTRRKVGKLKWNEAAARRALEQTRDVLLQQIPGSDRLRQPGRLPTLVMEDGAFLRTGDFGKIHLLFVDAWLNGTPKWATLLGFNRLLGIASLLAVFLALSTSLSCILVYAGFTMTFNSAFHLVLFAVLVCWAVNATAAFLPRVAEE